ncbi:hypothetical protein DS031_18060 [Bacillus taeanensis]|uniref:Uncharacterized protein n=1 Tax=Bacillus taeanensis TaxID=273032 RepID=A0A366XVG2_9BACI|nr:hypothetical protein DS031_18060 [Bacillus taeanensis]
MIFRANFLLIIPIKRCIVLSFSIIFKTDNTMYSSSTIRNAEGARLSTTSTRQDSWKIAFYLLDGLTCDLEPIAPAAGQIEMRKRPFSLDKQMFFRRKDAFYLYVGRLFDSRGWVLQLDN